MAKNGEKLQKIMIVFVYKALACIGIGVRKSIGVATLIGLIELFSRPLKRIVSS